MTLRIKQSTLHILKISAQLCTCPSALVAETSQVSFLSSRHHSTTPSMLESACESSGMFSQACSVATAGDSTSSSGAEASINTRIPVSSFPTQVASKFFLHNKHFNRETEKNNNNSTLNYKKREETATATRFAKSTNTTSLNTMEPLRLSEIAKFYPNEELPKEVEEAWPDIDADQRSVGLLFLLSLCVCLSPSLWHNSTVWGVGRQSGPHGEKQR